MTDQLARGRHQSTIQTQRQQTDATHADQDGHTIKVLALGGVAAGLASGLIALLTEREDKEPVSKIDQARAAIDSAAEKARKQGKKSQVDLSSGLTALSGRSGKAGRKAGKLAKHRMGRPSRADHKHAEETMANISRLLTAARDEVVGAYHTVEKQAPDVSALTQQLRSRAHHAVSEAQEGGRKLSGQAVKDASKLTDDLASLVDMFKSRAIDAEKVAESYVVSTLLPRLKEFEKEAGGVLEVGREKSHRMRERAQAEVIPQVKDNADKIRHTMSDQAKMVARTLERGSSEASGKMGAAAESVEEQARLARQAVKRSGRESRSLLVWLGIAGALVYNGFLNKDQQQKVREVAMEIFREARAMYSDITGEDGSPAA